MIRSTPTSVIILPWLLLMPAGRGPVRAGSVSQSGATSDSDMKNAQIKATDDETQADERQDDKAHATDSGGGNQTLNARQPGRGKVYGPEPDGKRAVQQTVGSETRAERIHKIGDPRRTTRGRSPVPTAAVLAWHDRLDEKIRSTAAPKKTLD